ncbi:hypothetical protein SUNI508_06301 [Seiridium unicorne]|uniref:Uncharacterized protein n=1 Tax=Seiridium unicorne TaxID=138068 RepID=A0ABR2V1L0_9PEZI
MFIETMGRLRTILKRSGASYQVLSERFTHQRSARCQIPNRPQSRNEMIVVSGDTEVMVTPRSQADAIDHVGENEASVSIGDVNIVIGKFASPSPEPDCESDPRRNTSASRDASTASPASPASPASESTRNYHHVVWAREFQPNRTCRIRNPGIRDDAASANFQLMDYVFTKNRPARFAPLSEEDLRKRPQTLWWEVQAHGCLHLKLDLELLNIISGRFILESTQLDFCVVKRKKSTKTTGLIIG